ncbi:hypothetical protein CERZMDRAFT_112004 [Cercospora zeae-maydis SCOH1-5]|uniref:Protein kinase domain-containing protein n=1 Tax=Cercospora zeae-maydis SCOH1-5 TaxID=717836 RepID=A0A6A6FFQ6_9PEZI|nr:hypothetical protein CERZMDRAFT_112004 [Cercospora zeae-maydis SCOH1-5]
MKARTTAKSADALSASVRISNPPQPPSESDKNKPRHRLRRVITKLGFGAYSTVWLARDEKTNNYASIKVFVDDDSTNSPVSNEIKTVQHLASCSKDHSGSNIARLPYDMFKLDGPTGKHHCFVSSPQGCSLWTLRHMFPNGRLPQELVWAAVRCLLGCVNWLDLDCNLIHTEITTQNVLTQAPNDDQFTAMEHEETLNPSVPVMDNNYPVYQSRAGPRSIRDITGVAYLTDFGSARAANEPHMDWWMPDTYRAPEVLMSVPWGCQVDVWSIGIMALELLEGRNLFEPLDLVNQQYVLPVAIAQYISVLGHPPLWMIQESQNPFVASLFDAEGCWRSDISIPHFSLEDWVTTIPEGEDKKRFLRFIRRILVWDPMQRATSSDVFLEFLDYQ